MKNKLHRPMILAPAGGRDQFITAINAGADAIYLGLKEFNARGRAENFSVKELKLLMPLARSKNVKILVTLNIVLKESELLPIIETLIELEWLGIHAVIIQDIGLARLIRQEFPALRMHASTQLAVHNLEGVLIAGKMGFQQVVLARELTAREISNIRKNTPPTIELEAFCHGSLCYSYSGLCFFSGAEDARSGNRGECAYTCRKPYKILNEPGHGFLFSMKDLNTSTDLEALVNAGINTLKIEGRMKDSQYVASSIGLYKNGLDKIFGVADISDRDFVKDGRFSFQRDTTSLFINGRYDENVIDLNNPTHKGIPVGTITSAYGNKITLITSETLELHDGLRIERAERVFHSKPQHGETTASQLSDAHQKYKNYDFQFPLLNLEVNGRPTTSVAKGKTVTITLPSNAPIAKADDRIFKVRSNELKRYTDSLQHIPERLREFNFIILSIDLLANQENEVTLLLTAKHGSETIYQTSFVEPATKPKEESRLEGDLNDLFKIFGDFQIECQVQITGDLDWYLPKSRLKSIKKEFATALSDTIKNYQNLKQKKLFKGSTIELKNTVSEIKYVIKFDRLEFLSTIEHNLQSGDPLNITEIIFEPKRAFLPKEKPEEILQQIHLFADANHLIFRLAIPMVLREWDMAEIKSWLKSSVVSKNKYFEVGNLGGIELLQSLGVDFATHDISADFTIYALNHKSAEELSALGFSSATLSIEDDLHNLQILLKNWHGPKPRMIIFKDTPLFIAEACSLTALHNGCPTGKVCGYRTLHIEDEQGERYFVAHESCKSIVFGDRAFSIVQDTNAIKSLGIDTLRLDFLTRQYSEESAIAVFTNAKNTQTIANTHTANFHGKLL
jgi:putative protease